MSVSRQTKWEWFPSEYLSFQEVNVPKIRGWRALVPYAVEASCAVPIDQLYVVPTPIDSHGRRYAAVLDKAIWQQQKSIFGSVALCPDILALPWVDTVGVCAVIEGERVRLRWGAWQGAAGSLSNMTFVLALLQKEQPLSVRLYSEQVPPNWRKFQIDHRPLSSYQPLQPSFDLAEGAENKWINWSMIDAWQKPLILTILLFIVWIAQSSLEAWQAQQQTRQLTQQMTELMTHNFPMIKKRVNPLAQAKSELAKRQLAVQAYDRSLLTLLVRVQQQLGSNVSVRQLNWQHETLSLSFDHDMTTTLPRGQLFPSWQAEWLDNNQLILKKKNDDN